MRGVLALTQIMRAAQTGRLYLTTAPGHSLPALLPAARAPLHYPIILEPDGRWTLPVFMVVPGRGYTGRGITSEMTQPTHFRILEKPLEEA